MDSKLGIIAGEGDIPIVVAKLAKTRGCRTIGFSLSTENRPGFEANTDHCFNLNIGEINSFLSIISSESLKEIVLVGKVSKEIIFSERDKFDISASKILNSLKEKSDESILNSFAMLMTLNGVKILDQRIFLEPFLAPRGILGKKIPGKEKIEEINKFYPVAKRITEMNIGQTIIIKDGVILAVEAIEGTDEAIRRGASLGRGGVSVIKVAKSDQDYRFDTPSIGLKTINVLKETGGGIIAIESDRVAILERESVIKECDDAEISIIGI